MKYLIVGLGNIGREYDNTRHNIGFKVIDHYALKNNAIFSTDRLGDVASFKLRGNPVVLLKPSTYMNLSGKAVNYWMQKEKIDISNVLIVLDDLALKFGTLRLRQNGSEGGHNGLKSITECLGSNNYARLRFGIGNDYPKGQQVDYVLGKWTSEQESLMPDRLNVFSDAIDAFVCRGVVGAMNAFNGK